MMNHTIYLARLTVEAASPLGIGSGRRGITSDRLVARDAYGLPYLPGTSLAGCLRSALADTTDPRIIDDLLGSLNTDGGTGSRVVLTSGHLVGSDGKVTGESGGVPKPNDSYLQSLTEGLLPERDHVRINSRGVADAKGHGKFDEQLVPRGVRFVFDVSLAGRAGDSTDWQDLLQQFSQPFFRIGGGTRKGFGKLRIVSIDQVKFNLRDAEQREAYLDVSTALDVPLPLALTSSVAPATAPVNSNWLTYTLRLKARDYFQFGHGIGGETKNGKSNAKGEKGWVSKLAKQEPVVDWHNERPRLLNGDEAHYLLPATSVKGALSHRTAFHYNKMRDAFVENQTITLPKLEKAEVVQELINGNGAATPTTADSIQREIGRLEQLLSNADTLSLDERSPAFAKYTDELTAAQTDEARPNVGENNDAVRALFGYAVDRQESESAQRGRVLIDDVFLPADKVTPKTFSHVMIDRFTGGAKAGALFSEEVASTDEEITFTIHVETVAFDGENGATIQAAFEEALLDLTHGQLPLGGGVAKGHGIFEGKLTTSETQQA